MPASNTAVSMISSALLTWVIAVASPLRAEEPGPATQPADIQAARREIDLRLKDLFEAAPKIDSDILTRMRADGAAFNELIARIDGFLQTSSEEETRNNMLIERLRCLYFASSLGAQPRTRFEQEVRRLIAETNSETIRQEAEYWQLRLDLHDWHALQAIGEGDEADGPRRIREFIGRFPHFSAAVPLVEGLIVRAYENGEDREAGQLLEFLERHHPDHVTTRALLGRDRLRRAIGRPWRPLLETVDGQLVEWSAMGGRPVIVVFWAPRHEQSVEMLRGAAEMQQRVGPEKLGILTIAMDVQQEAVVQALREAKPVGPAAWEKRAWGSDLAQELGIRSLPLVLLLDRESNLERIFVPDSWETPERVQEAVGGLIQPRDAQPAESGGSKNATAAASQPAEPTTPSE